MSIGKLGDPNSLNADVLASICETLSIKEKYAEKHAENQVKKWAVFEQLLPLSPTCRQGGPKL